MTILVVDDSAAIRERLVETLSTVQGVEYVLTAANAAEAREVLRSIQPDLLVLDIHLSVGSGIDVLDAMRNDDQQIVTIVLTNDASPPCRTASFRAGADFFFDKSAEFQEAVDVIARLALGHNAFEDGRS